MFMRCTDPRFQHCPSGDDPITPEDETDCSGVEAPGGRGVGEEGNLCQVDCSNRGLCDHGTGECACFNGFHGPNCAMPDEVLARHELRLRYGSAMDEF